MAQDAAFTDAIATSILNQRRAALCRAIIIARNIAEAAHHELTTLDHFTPHTQPAQPVQGD